MPLKSVRKLHSELLLRLLALFVCGFKVLHLDGEKVEATALPRSMQHMVWLHGQLTSIIGGVVSPTPPGSLEALQRSKLLELLDLENLGRFRHEHLLLEQDVDEAAGCVVDDEELGISERDYAQVRLSDFNQNVLQEESRLKKSGRGSMRAGEYWREKGETAAGYNEGLKHRGTSGRMTARTEQERLLGLI